MKNANITNDSIKILFSCHLVATLIDMCPSRTHNNQKKKKKQQQQQLLLLLLLLLLLKANHEHKSGNRTKVKGRYRGCVLRKASYRLWLVIILQLKIAIVIVGSN